MSRCEIYPPTVSAYLVPTVVHQRFCLRTEHRIVFLEPTDRRITHLPGIVRNGEGTFCIQMVVLFVLDAAFDFFQEIGMRFQGVRRKFPEEKFSTRRFKRRKTCPGGKVNIAWIARDK